MICRSHPDQLSAWKRGQDQRAISEIVEETEKDPADYTG
jgi:hypothetical protein